MTIKYLKAQNKILLNGEEKKTFELVRVTLNWFWFYASNIGY